MQNKNLQVPVLVLLGGVLVALSIIWYQGLDAPILFSFDIKDLAIGVVTIISIFLIIREFLTWYWKINRMVDLLEKIERNTSRQENQNSNK